MAEAPPTDRPARRRWSKNQKIGTGLLLTLVGLALITLLLPTTPSSVGHVLPIAAGAVLALWVGGILMGIGSRS